MAYLRLNDILLWRESEKENMLKGCVTDIKSIFDI